MSGRYCVRSCRKEIAASFVSANRACRSDVVSSGSRISRHSRPANAGSTSTSDSDSSWGVSASGTGVFTIRSSREKACFASIFACSAVISLPSAASRALYSVDTCGSKLVRMGVSSARAWRPPFTTSFSTSTQCA